MRNDFPSYLANEGWQIHETQGQYYGFNHQTKQSTEAFDSYGLAMSAIFQFKVNPEPLNPNRTYLVDVSLLKDNPWQTRQKLDKGHIKALAEDIRQRGLMQPPMGRIVPAGTRVLGTNDLTERLRYKKAHVELAFGHNRAAAYRLLAKQDDNYRLVPIQIRELDDKAMANMAWSENSARKDLNPVEEALAIQKRCEDFGWNQKEVAEELGLSPSAISNKLRLLRLPEDVQEEMKRGELSERQAMALAPLYDLPASTLAKAAKCWNNPEKIRSKAADQSSAETRRQVKEVINYVSENLALAAWPIDKHLDGDFHSATCTTCEFNVKKRCHQPPCHNSKLVVWGDNEINQAHQKLGIPIVNDEFSWLDYSSLSSDDVEAFLDLAAPCSHLRLYFAARPYRTTPESPLLDAHPQIELICNKKRSQCDCRGIFEKEKRRQEREEQKNDLEYQEEKKKQKEIQEIVELAENQLTYALLEHNQRLWLRLLRWIQPSYNGKGKDWSTHQIATKIIKQLISSRFASPEEALKAMFVNLHDAGLEPAVKLRIEEIKQKLKYIDSILAAAAAETLDIIPKELAIISNDLDAMLDEAPAWRIIIEELRKELRKLFGRLDDKA